MTEKAETILREALALNDSERAEIAGLLLESIEPPADVDIEEAWREEVRRRVAQLEAGDTRLIPWEEVREQLYARLKE